MLVLALVLLAYQLLLNTIYLFLLVVAGRAMRTHLRAEPAQALPDVFASPFTPGVSLLIPCYNERTNVVESLHSLLGQQYPDLEVVVVNDGSSDDTLEILIEAFDLVHVRRVDPANIPSERIRGVYESPRYPNLLVVDKENGGRADAMNAALRFAAKDLVCQMDADSILEPDALLRVVTPFVDEPDEVVGVGGIIRLVNGCTVEGGRVSDVKLSRNWWVRFQVVEYLRSFLIGRLGWAQLNAQLLISGAFGLWRRDLVIEAGGYTATTLGEDAELTMRMHRLMRDKRVPYKITFVPDPVCWTEAPESRAVLKRQRRRWSRGLGESLWLNRKLAFNPLHGTCGLLGYPYYLLFEFLGAVLELAGYVAFPVMWVLGVIDVPMLVLFFVVSVLYSSLLTVSGVLLEALTFHYYTRRRDLMTLVGFALLEHFWFHQMHVWWRCLGIWDLAARRTAKWGKMDRVGFTTTDASAEVSGRAA